MIKINTVYQLIKLMFVIVNVDLRSQAAFVLHLR